MGFAGLTAEIDELADVDPCRLGHGDTVLDLRRQLARLDAIVTRATAAFDASQRWQDDGAQSLAMWMMTRAPIPKSAAKAEIGLGRALRHLPETEKAWLAGDINRAHVRAMAEVRNPTTADELAQAEAMLVAHATQMRYSDFARVLAYWAQDADPDGADDADGDDLAARMVHLSQSLRGMWFGNLVMDRISGTILAETLRAIELPMFEADYAEAKARLGRAPRLDELARTPAQRRADALVEMAIRARTAPKDGKRPEPLFTALVGNEKFARLCELANRAVIAPATLLPWLDQAWIERAVFDGPSRVIDIGIRRRLFKGATRRAVEIRDLECFHQYCDTPSDRCQIDHIHPYVMGGFTIQANGRPACGFHNRARPNAPPPD